MGSDLIKPNLRPLEIYYSMCFSYIIFQSGLLFILYLRDGKEKSVSNILAESVTNVSVNELPFCVNRLLNRQDYFYDKWAKGLNENFLLISKIKMDSCRLLPYTAKPIVSCFDQIYQERINNNKKIFANETKPPNELQFVFMGDSRIRQQYYNFIKQLPDYDKKTQPDPMSLKWKYDMEFTSELLGLRVSFLSRPLLNESVIDTLRRWTVSKQSERPFWILLSIAVHHMLQENGGDFRLYRKKFIQLAPVLGQLGNVSNVIWMNQYPSVDQYDDSTNNGLGHNTDIHSEKIHAYNEAIRHILKSEKSVSIWDSSNPLVEEYVRSCTVYPLREALKGTFSLQYIACEDYIHSGNAALSQATQLLINDICNKKLYERK